MNILLAHIYEIKEFWVCDWKIKISNCVEN